MNYTKVTSEALDAIISLFENYISDDDTWISSHISIAFDDVETAMTIKIWDMDEQDYALNREFAIKEVNDERNN